MDSLVKTKRDLIELKNGLFKYNLSQSYIPGVALQGNRHDCKFGFFIPPLNEMGFSDKYSQCLIKLFSYLTSRVETPILMRQLDILRGLLNSTTPQGHRINFVSMYRVFRNLLLFFGRLMLMGLMFKV